MQYHRRRVRRPYFFELFVLANLAVIAVFARETYRFIDAPLKMLGGLLLSMVIQAALGIGIRAAVAAVRRERTYLRIVRTRAWLEDTARLVVASALIVFTYGWIKLAVPITHEVLLDEALWKLDQAMFFGVAPTVFVLNLFQNPAMLRAIDWSYANIFFLSTLVAGAYFLSEPSRRIRIAFTNGYALLWLVGAWLYMLVPSLGPAYRFQDIWLPHSDTLQVTQSIQSLLMINYHNLIRAEAGQPHAPISLVLGIAAFPSLHVAFQMYVCLWMRRLWKWGELLFILFVVVIFLGSMITGWHYFIDGITGLILAYGCYRVFFRRARVLRWLELRRP